MNPKLLFTPLLLVVSATWMFAQELVLDSAYYDVGIVQAEDFENTRRNYYRTYDEDNRPLVVETQRNMGSDTWENWRRREYTYSENGDLTSLLIAVWRPNFADWTPFKERNFTYDQSGNVLTKEVRTASQPGGELMNTRRWEYTYEDQDLQTVLLFQRWVDGAWVDDSRQLWSYNANGLTTAQLRQFWDGTAWQDVRRRLWNYDAGIVSSVTEQVYDAEAEEWVNERRKGYQNSGSALWDQSVEQEWNSTAGAWENVRREVFSYTANGMMDNVTLQFWEGEAWLNTMQTEYQLVDDAVNILADQWSEGSGSWEASARYQLRFNEAGRKIVEQGWQYWSEQMGAWINAIDTDRWRYFWSEVIVNTAEPTPDADCRWPNPYQAGQSISCTSLPQAGTLTLELVNSVGQVVHQQALAGGADFQIQASLPQGWYVCRIQQQGQLLHVQPLVFVP